ncbi:BspA family leucine-rich repeat surface protein [Lactococcus lactis]|uniref:BspA family leucine-rich repeat surface protein n=1 Tax=Lactococcus lactis TaxID=1358 RepID=UPI0024173A42|nr:BspA family leucine-rich repeat surface protein [Lactococcus lactis]MDG4959786.1 BspA family leucine-rich repeat surface protein [Lactococcus lactis]
MKKVTVFLFLSQLFLSSVVHATEIVENSEQKVNTEIVSDEKNNQEDEQNQDGKYDQSEKTLENDSKSQQRDVKVVASGHNGMGFTWTLYEDGLLTLGGGTWLGGYPGWWSSYRSKIKTVKIIDDVDTSLTNQHGYAYMFTDCVNLVSVEGLEHLSTQNSTSFSSMFNNCESLQTIDLTSFDTSNSVRFSKMFYGCSSLENVDVSQFDTSKALYFDNMFTFCRKLTELDVSHFNTSKATTFATMFYGCNSLLELDITNFDTSNCTNFSQMFGGLKVNNLNLTNLNTEKAENMSFMFQNASNITTLDLSSFKTNNVTNMEYMFQGMRALTELDVTGFNVENVQKISACFSDLTNIEKLELSNFKTINLAGRTSDYVFRNLTNLKELNIENWVLPENEAAYKFFENTLPEKMTIGQNFRFTTSMYLSEVPSGSTWVNKSDSIIFSSNKLLNFHNSRGLTDTYRIEKLYTLKFDTMGGTSIQSQQNIYGKTWNIPEVPEKNGFIFDYWSTDKEGNEPFNFSSTINESITLYAQYSPAYIVNIPATVNLNEENKVAVSAENFQEDKQLIVSTSDTLILKNTHDSTMLLQKNITTENSLEEGKVLEINGVGKSKNTLTIQESTEKEAAGKYKGVLDFIIDFN